MANFITILRIVFSPFLLLLTPLSPSYYSLYLALGLSDILDGIIARKTHTVSKLGSMLDSIGDILFSAIAFITIWPFLSLTLPSILIIASIFILRVTNIIVGLYREKKLIMLHTKVNKLTGLLLFLFPLTLTFVSSFLSIPLISLFALYGALEEGYLIWKRKLDLL
ncbi:MAG: CDP-alcohol phosphatidyltransferase family protein [Spirochaetales bacterium]|nr:CDP-alcohol phosphatidyltransferase family protein [Spirochaetales bacterium]